MTDHIVEKKKGKVTNERKKENEKGMKEYRNEKVKEEMDQNIEEEKAERVREWLNEISKERRKDRKFADVGEKTFWKDGASSMADLVGDESIIRS